MLVSDQARGVIPLLLDLMLLVSLLLIFLRFGSSSHMEQPPLLSRQAGLMTPKSASYISAVITALYSIPKVQETFYSEAVKQLSAASPNDREILKHSFILSTVLNFIKLRSQDQPFALNPEYYESVVLSETEHYQVIDKYWERLLESSFPAELLKLFMFNIKFQFWDTSDNLLNESNLLQSAYVKVNVGPETCPRLSEFIDNGCLGNDQMFPFKRVLNGKTYEFIPKRSLTNTSTVLCFSLGRFMRENGRSFIQFKNDPMEINHEIVLNSGQKYILAARIEYDLFRGIYNTISYDFLSRLNYVYESNGRVTASAVDPVFSDTRSILLFYVSESSLSECHLESFRLLKDIPESVFKLFEYSDNRQQRPNGLWDQIFRPDCSRLISVPFSTWKAIEAAVSSKFNIWPMEMINVYSKILHRVYLLGSEEYSFKTGPGGKSYVALEIVLSCLASNLRCVEKLFEITKEPNALRSVEFRFAMVVTQMLLGCKNISLDRLAGQVASLTGLCLEMDGNMNLIFNQIIGIVNCIQSGKMIGIPTMKTVQFVDFDSDDILRVNPEGPLIPLRASQLIKSTPACIKGVWFDLKNVRDKARERRIYKSNSETFCVEVDRFSSAHDLDKSSVNYNSEDYECCGVVCLEEKSGPFNNYFVNELLSKAFRLATSGGSAINIPRTAKNIAFFERTIKSKSVLLFFKKKSPEGEGTGKRVTSAKIPLHLYKELIKELGNEHGINI